MNASVAKTHQIALTQLRFPTSQCNKLRQFLLLQTQLTVLCTQGPVYIAYARLSSLQTLSILEPHIEVLVVTDEVNLASLGSSNSCTLKPSLSLQ